MTLEATAGQDFKIFIRFLEEDQYVVPDENSVTVSVKDNAQTELWPSADNPIAGLSAGATTFPLIIPAALNQKTKDFEYRTVLVSFTSGGVPHQFLEHYILTDGFRLPLNPSDVRAVWGLDPKDVPDDKINLRAAMARVSEDLNDLDIESLLQAGDARSENLIEAIKIKAAWNLGATIEALLFQSEEADNTSYRRFNGVDYQKVLNRLEEQYADLLNVLLGNDSTSTADLSQMFTDTDPITGA